MASIKYFADGKQLPVDDVLVHCLVCGEQYTDGAEHVCPVREVVVAPNYFEAFRERVLEAAEDDIIPDTDWVFWPTHNKGFYTAASLRVLADELDRRNEELWSDE